MQDGGTCIPPTLASSLLLLLSLLRRALMVNNYEYNVLVLDAAGMVAGGEGEGVQDGVR